MSTGYTEINQDDDAHSAEAEPAPSPEPEPEPMSEGSMELAEEDAEVSAAELRQMMAQMQQQIVALTPRPGGGEVQRDSVPDDTSGKSDFISKQDYEEALKGVKEAHEAEVARLRQAVRQAGVAGD